MNTINISADATAQRIGIGNQYENLATAVVFDCSKFAEDHGAGTAQVVHRRPTESIGYVCTDVAQEGNTVTWLVTDDDTSFTGKGLVQLRWYVDDVLRESVIFPTYILPSVTSSDDAPADVKSALEQLMEYIKDNTISTEDLDERIANYFYDHPLPMEGEADGLVAGSAKQLLSDSYTLDQVPYLFRKSPDSDRAVEEIVGGTVGWNQLCKNGDFSDGSNYWAKSDSQDSYSIDNGVYTLTLSSAPVNYYGHRIQNNPSSSISGHKVLCSCYMRSSKQCGFVIGLTNSTPASGLSKANTANQWSQVSNIMSVNANGTYSLQCSPGYSYSELSAGDTIDIKNVIVSDLTTLFGSTIADYIYSLETATAGAGVDWVRQYIDLDTYHPYCEPTLKSVEGLQSKKTVGFNQWDGKLNSAVDGWKISTNYMPVVPGETYYTHLPTWSSGAMYAETYDAGKTLINGSFSLGRNETFTVPNNVCFLKPKIWHTADETNICINLSDPTRNGQYEPYESHTYSLDSEVVLRGIPKLDSNNNLYFDGDVYPADGNGSRRYALVTFDGSDDESWSYYTISSSDNANNLFRITIPTRKSGSLVTGGCELFALGYVKALNSSTGRTHLTISGANTVVDFVNKDYSSVADWKAYLAQNPITVLYELATPTTFTATPYHNPQIVGDTEEFVTTGIVPVGHSTKYYQNLRKKIEGLPWNFATLIAPTEATNNATRNYTAGSYLILNNTLYKVTSNIANGGNITPNTNVTATTIMAEIMSL